MGQIQAYDILSRWREAGARIRNPPTIQCAEANERLPLRFPVVQQREAGRDDTRIVIGSVADRPAPITLTGFINAVIVGAIQYFARLMEGTTGAGKFPEPAV